MEEKERKGKERKKQGRKSENIKNLIKKKRSLD
jgi:hypothetical protein